MSSLTWHDTWQSRTPLTSPTVGHTFVPSPLCNTVLSFLLPWQHTQSSGETLDRLVFSFKLIWSRGTVKDRTSLVSSCTLRISLFHLWKVLPRLLMVQKTTDIFYFIYLFFLRKCHDGKKRWGPLCVGTSVDESALSLHCGNGVDKGEKEEGLAHERRANKACSLWHLLQQPTWPIRGCGGRASAWPLTFSCVKFGVARRAASVCLTIR